MRRPAEEVPESAAEVVAFLTSQHQQLTAIVDTVVDSGGARRRLAFDQLRRLLAVHEASEQTILHPRASYELTDGSAIVARRLEEERHLGELMTEIEGQGPDSSTFTDAMSTWRIGLLTHLRREEELEFAGLRIQLGSRQLQRMDNAVRLAAECLDHLGLRQPGLCGPAAHAETFADMLSYACDEICVIDDDDS